LADSISREPMLDMYIFETNQMLEQLEQAVLDSEQSGCFDSAAIHSIFRIMHTIKGSSAMMLFNSIASLAHSIEDLFFFIREQKPVNVDCSQLTDLILASADFIKTEIGKIEQGRTADGDAQGLIELIQAFLTNLKAANPLHDKPEEGRTRKPQKYYIAADKSTVSADKKSYQAVIFFEEGCEMENIRAFTIIHNLKELADDINHSPADIIENDQSVDIIRQTGFQISFKSDRSSEVLFSALQQTAFVKALELSEVTEAEPAKRNTGPKQIVLEDHPPKMPELPDSREHEKDQANGGARQHIISVSVAKLDKLMDIVGELVIAEAMVTQHPELVGISLDGFHKAARQLHKITGELRDIVMSVRMMPLAATFQKMNRIVRDACKKTNKEVRLEIVGEETEVDKNIIEQLSDPLMHLIRNSIDHGIEPAEERQANGKPVTGKVVLEARNEGSDVWIIVRDDGRGLNKEKIVARAKANGLLTKPEHELTDKEIYSFICLPGFSTKDSVTEMSGRGVGMDVVVQNVQKTGGTVLIDSVPGQGTVISVKIPLTMAIIDGMTVKVGNARYTVPTVSIRQSFRPKPNDVITDPDGREMLLIRGECLPILRLHQFYDVDTAITEIHNGIIVIIENDSRSLCLFADELLGQQQVVIKTLPAYIKKIQGLAGCTLLGDGNISLILDVPGLFQY